jgi:oligopeptide transport system substrate-binding protein
MKNERKKFRKFCFLLLVFAFSLSLHAASHSIDIGNGGEPRDLDPHLVTGNPDGHILLNLFEGLVGKDPQTLKIIPAVAKKWKISSDGKNYTFFLRENALWSDGTPLTANDFVYAWGRFVKRETAAEYAYQAEPIASFSAKDRLTFNVTLKRPVPYFLPLITHWAFYPVPQSTIERHGLQWTRPGKMVSNGPFLLHGWELNKVITLKKNPKYWDSGKVRLEEVRFHAIAVPDIDERMFRAGKIHSVNDIPIERLPFWKKDTSGVFHASPFLGVYFYWINVKKPPLDNLWVRKALAYALDREKIVRYVTKGDQAQALAFTPPNCGGYTAKPVLPGGGKGIAQAKEFLKKAGYPDGKGFPTIELLFNSNDNIKKIAEATQAMWKENLGISVTLHNEEWKVFLDSQAQGNFFLSRAGWTADYNDPTTFLDLLITGNGNNHAGWSNKKYDEFMRKASLEMNPAKRFKAFENAEMVLMEELPVIPIYFYTRLTLRSTKVKGWYDNVEDYHPLKEVYLDPS